MKIVPHGYLFLIGGVTLVQLSCGITAALHTVREPDEAGNRRVCVAACTIRVFMGGRRKNILFMFCLER